MGPFTRIFSLLFYFVMFWLFWSWGHKFFPAYLGCALWAYLAIYTLFSKDPPEDDKGKKQ